MLAICLECIQFSAFSREDHRYFIDSKMVIFSIFACFLLLPFCYGATDTIITGQSINESQTITSSGGKFQLGFSNPAWRNNNLTYIVMWCKDLKEEVVWVANRENPIIDSTGAVLKNGNDGNLMIVDAGGTTIWSTNISSLPNETTEAVLLDSGNLILRGRGGEIRWQSFDYPTDTLLPGMKLGINLKTGTKWSLTSEAFELSMDSQGEIFAYKDGIPQWRGGYWNGESFNGLPEMTRDKNIYNYSFVSYENEVYFSYNSSLLSRLVLCESGLLKQFALVKDGKSSEFWNLTWYRERSRCEEYGACGPFAVSSCKDNIWTISCSCLQGLEPKIPGDWNGGCWRKSVLGCGKEHGGFVSLARMKLPERGVQRRGAESFRDCEAECVSNCSCVAFALVNSKCLVWSGNLTDLRQYDSEGQGGVFYLRLPASEQVGAKNRLLVIVMSSIILGSILLLSGMFFFWKRARKRDNSIVVSKHGEGWVNAPKLIASFNLHTITAATENFCIANKLGEGGFGPVYKGKLSKGEEIAVKMLSRRSTQGLEEFKNEVALISTLQHKNLVRLLGCCIEEEEKMLIYEYMPNKSLDLFLFDPTKRAMLDWGKSFHIIEGIAHGLLYLHRYSRLRIIHRDLKASNVLLDSDMNAKISDFGMARISEGNQNQANTERVVGTYGYMSPEYALDGRFSEKSDVFSFGVLLLEIISGKRNNGVYHLEQSMNLIGYAWTMWREGRELEFLDPSLGNSYRANEVLKCIYIGLLCVQEDPADRPTMSSIIFMLGSEITTSPTPRQPAFSMGKIPIDSSSCSSISGSCSIKEVNIARVEPR